MPASALTMACSTYRAIRSGDARTLWRKTLVIWFSRDQPKKIYIQDRMRQTLSEIRRAYLKEEGAFYLCGPTWPVPDVTSVLEEAVEVEARSEGKKKDGHKEIERLKEEGRYVLEVY